MALQKNIFVQTKTIFGKKSGPDRPDRQRRPCQADRYTRMEPKYRKTIHRTTTDPHNGSKNKQKVKNNRTTALERTAA